MNETERMVAEAIQGGDADEALRILVEAAPQGNIIVRLCPDRDHSHDFSLRIAQQLDFKARRCITTMFNGFIGCMQQGMFQLDRIEIEPIQGQ